MEIRDDAHVTESRTLTDEENFTEAFPDVVVGGVNPDFPETQSENFSCSNWFLCFDDEYNSLNSSVTSSFDVIESGFGQQWTNNYWTLLLVFFPLLTVFGNVLVVLSVYREKSLRSVTNYFIVSLAIADIMVAILVMPLAVYVEVNRGNWELGDALCDTWVALDVMCCTASILNLAAISVDRFMAVTQPIRYAKHKNSNRVYAMLALTWIVSIAISSPIAVGANYTERRAQTPLLCIFYNSDFLIYSSMGSFYIPCIVMVLLYWRIFHAIRQRSRKAAATAQKSSTRPSVSPAALASASASSAKVNNTGKAAMSDAPSSRGMVEEPSVRQQLLPKHCMAIVHEEGIDLDPSGEQLEMKKLNGKGGESGRLNAPNGCNHISGSTVISNTAVTDLVTDTLVDYDTPNTVTVNVHALDVTNSPRLSVPARHPTFAVSDQITDQNNSSCSPAASHCSINQKNDRSQHRETSGTVVTKFCFRFPRRAPKKTSRGSAAQNAHRREKKATKTLAIVLGVFLLCWVPFFTINIINAICIRYDLFDNYQVVCQIDAILFSFFVWLGYMNSFLNPVIYTIFNIEFRRAFKKILLAAIKRQ